ncbi:MAG: cation diffusion facilitator family transporter [Bacteroidaceae bacterium]
MAHSHTHSNSNTTKNLSVAFFLNAFFVMVELIGGLLTNSIAILSDALHDFGDCLSLAVAWILQKKSTKGRDLKYSYGYKRFSLLGSVFLSGVLSISSVFVVVEAVKRIAAPQEVDAHGMLWLAVVGVCINGAAAFRLKKGPSLNERAVFLHIMEDVLGWIAVLFVSIVMLFVHLPILDPLLSIAISLWVLSHVYKNLRDTFRVFLQATPDKIDLKELQTKIEQLPGVDSIHDLHVWTMDGMTHVMTLHVVSTERNASFVKQEVLTLGKAYHIDHVTIELEASNAECLHRCD